MGGAPIKQARHAIEDCLARLSHEDQVGLVFFDSTVESFRHAMLPATGDNVEKACTFLNTVDARGGTELASGVEAAAQLLGEQAGEIFVVTDGQVAGTVDILRRSRKCEIRLFCLGIGSASQDRFLELLARQTGGVCRFVTPSERVDVAAAELFATLGGIAAKNVSIPNANVQPSSAGPVFSGTPFVAFGDIDSNADAIAIESSQGARHVAVEPLDANNLDGLIKRLQGAKLIADFEAGYDRSDAAARQQLLELSQHYGMASSELSLVAVVKRAEDKAGDVPKTKIVPVGMPQDTRFGSYFSLAATRAPLLASFSTAGPAFDFCKVQSRTSPSICSRILALDRESDLLSILREAIRVIDEYASTRLSDDLSTNLASLLQKLVFHQGRTKIETDMQALTSLIDFISSDMIDFLDTGHFDQEKWQVIRCQLEQSWPELENVCGVVAHD
jgi:Ca-activated chloride channel family protein